MGSARVQVQKPSTRQPVSGPAAQEKARPASSAAPGRTNSLIDPSRAHHFGQLAIRPPVQPRPTVSAPHDPLEREADWVAEAVMRMPEPPMQHGQTTGAAPLAAKGGGPIRTSFLSLPIQPPVQRKASNPGKEERAGAEEEEEEREEEEEEATKKPPPIQAMANPASPPETPPAFAGMLARARGQGAPLPPPTRTFMESRFAHDFSHVRVHTDGGAARMARSIHARAFTHAQDIFFDAGQYQPETPAGRRLIAHELAHTVQQTGPRLLASSPVQLTASPFSPAIQRYGLGEFVSDVGDVAGAVVKSGTGVVRAGGKLLAEGAAVLVRRVSPGLADLIEEGPRAWVRRNVEVGLRGVLGRLFNVNLADVVASLRDTLGAAFESFAAFAKGGVASACDLFIGALDALRDLARLIADNPAIRTLRDALGAVSGAVSRVTRIVFAAGIEGLAEVAGGIFRALRGAAKTVSGWLKSVREFASTAWDWVAERLGVGAGAGETGEEGVFSWFKRLAGDVWGSIRETFAPFAGPIKTAGKVLLALSPLGPLYALVKYGPEVVRSVQWLWAHRGDPDIIRAAHEQMGSTFLPGLLVAIRGFRDRLARGAGWLLERLAELSTALLKVVEGMTGIPLLGILQSAVQSLSESANRLLAWATGALDIAVEAVTSVTGRVRKIVEPYKEVLSSIAMAILNPAAIPVILAGWAWKAIPSCFKAPIINFLLDIAIEALDALPEPVMFGPLWPLLKSGVLGFLRRIRSQPAKVQEAVADKIAKILRGSSPAFLFGFVKGFFKGVWEGVADPIKLLWQVVEGLNHVLEWLERLAEEALDPGAARRRAPPVEGTASPAAEPAPTADIGQRAAELAGELRTPLSVVASQFWGAVEEYFSAGEGSFDTLLAKFGELWQAMRDRVALAGGELADKVAAFFTGEEAEDKLGEGVGWLAGMIAFQVVLDVLSAGTWAAAYPALQALVRFINWPMEALGRVAQLIGRIGRYVVDGVKKLGQMISRSAGGALRAVKEALGTIGEKLVAFADDLVSRFGGRAAREGAERGAGRVEQAALHEAEEQAARGAGKKATRETGEQAEQRSGREVEERGARKDKHEAAEEAAQIPAAKAAARAIEAVLEARGAPLPVLFAALEAGLMPRFRWIKGFKSRPYRGGHLVYIVASEIPTNEDDPYGDEPEFSGPAGSKPPKGTPEGDAWRYKRYRAEGGELDYDEWYKRSRGGRSGGPGHQEIQGKLVGAQPGARKEVSVGDRVADAYWPTGPNGKPVYHQIGGRNASRGDPIVREREAIEDLREALGDDVDIYFWDKTAPDAPPLINPDRQPGWIPSTRGD